MPVAPREITLELVPERRRDLIDVAARVRATVGDVLAGFPKAFYTSYHTTAGYLEQSVCAWLGHDANRLGGFVGAFGELFPSGAGYQHDRLDLRHELTDEQRVAEPPNGDSHLTYIGAGLRNCVTYVNHPGASVYFVDLDGVYGSTRRTRRTTILGFHDERPVESFSVEVPVSRHRVDSINLRDSRIGLFEEIERRIALHAVGSGSVEISLEPSEDSAALTVNEYETLLMKHDLLEVLRNPFRFAAEKGRHIWADPHAVPRKTRDYAKYDLVRLFNEVLDALGVGESFVERLAAKFLAVPASRFLRVKRAVSLYVGDPDGEGRRAIVAGPYQTPILVQWERAPRESRRLQVSIRSFE